MRYAFPGDHGSYAEDAVLRHFGSGAETVPCTSNMAVFEEVQAGKADYGVVPAENSIQGPYSDTMDYLYSSDLRINGEIFEVMRHQLVANPGTRIGDVKRVYSQDLVFKQCSRYMKEIGIERPVPQPEPVYGLKKLKEDRVKDAAAIVSRRAAEIYGMEILKEDIQDSSDAQVRYLVMGRNPDRDPTGNDKTSVILNLKHEQGSLFRIVKALSDRGVNIMNIQSRPTKQTPWEYRFYIEFEGHAKESKIRGVLDEAREKSIWMKVLGSYPKGELRR